MQVKSEQLAKETGELVALRQQLLQRERELSQRAAEQSSEGATLKVVVLPNMQPRFPQPLAAAGILCCIAAALLLFPRLTPCLLCCGSVVRLSQTGRRKQC